MCFTTVLSCDMSVMMRYIYRVPKFLCPLVKWGYGWRNANQHVICPVKFMMLILYIFTVRMLFWSSNTGNDWRTVVILILGRYMCVMILCNYIALNLRGYVDLLRRYSPYCSTRIILKLALFNHSVALSALAKSSVSSWHKNNGYCATPLPLPSSPRTIIRSHLVPELMTSESFY